jgi:hypothetical protein
VAGGAGVDSDACNQAEEQFRNQSDRDEQVHLIGVAPIAITATKLAATVPIRE